MDTSLFKKLGLNDKEIKTYLTLLENGALSVRNLAELAELNRGTIYDVLKKLQEAGLVSYYHQNTKQKFVAEDPEKILGLFKSKRTELEKAESKMSDLIPELRSIMDKNNSSPVTKFYEGRDGIKYILEDVLSTLANSVDKEYYIYSAARVSDDLNGAYPNFTKERIKHGIRVKAISLSAGGQTYGLDERRWLDTNEQSATFIIIYGGKCAFVSKSDLGSPVGVIIENNNIYETQKIIFGQLWELLGKN